MERHIRIPKPAYTSEFVLIVVDALGPRGCDDVPKRYVNMTSGETNRRRARHHQRLRNVVCRNKPKFLAELAHYCIARAFPWLHVASGREPELRAFVIYEKNSAAVKHIEV